jgi:hypothetical protein
MPLFTWPDKSSCGDTPSDSCAPLPYKESVKALRATDSDSSCEVDLTSSEHPSIPVILSDELTEPRSGSASNPIPISLVQQYAGTGPVPTLLYRNLAGELQAWDPPSTCDNKKVVVENGSFALKEDVNSNIFEEACLGVIADAEYIAAARAFVDCNGATKIKLIFVDKNEICTYCS